GAVLGEVEVLEDMIATDPTLSTEDKGVLLAQAKKIEDETRSLWRVLVDKAKKVKHDFSRKPGTPWYQDRLINSSEGEVMSLDVIRQNLAAVSERLAYIAKKKLSEDDDGGYANRPVRKNEAEAKAAITSAWNHLSQASINLQQRLTGGENEQTKKLETENIEAAFEFWKMVLEHPKPSGGADAISWVDSLIYQKDKNYCVPREFFEKMPDALRKGFHKALLDRLAKGVKDNYRDKPRDATSYDVVKFYNDYDLTQSYVSYLERNFKYEDLLTILDTTKPVHNEAQLLGLDRDKGSYYSLHGQGLEDNMANMAIHRSALEMAGEPADVWHGDDIELLNRVKENTEASLPAYLEKLYESLKDHPTVLIQAFKGLLRFPTWYYSPAGAYKDWAGYRVYSEQKGHKVMSFKNEYGGFNSFEEQSQKMKGYVFELSSPEDISLLLDFVLEKGKTNPHLNTLGAMFVDRVGKAAKDEQSPTAQKIGDALVSKDVEAIRKFTHVFPGDLFDGGAFFNKYTMRRINGVDIIEKIDINLLAAAQSKDYSTRKYIVKFATEHADDDDAPEKIGEYAHNICTFVKAVGFYHEHAYSVATIDPQKAADNLAVLDDLPKNIDRSVAIRILDTYETWLQVPPEKRESYIKVITLINNSTSQEIKRIANELIGAIIDSDDPLDSWQKIEAIFIKNNLPLVGKIFKIFNVLHPADKMDKTLTGNSRLSPYLRKASPKRREYTIFTDLLKVHIESGNRSLRQYLEILRGGEKFFATLDSSDEGQDLSADDLKRLQVYITKLNTIFLESQLGAGASHILGNEKASFEQIKAAYLELRNSLETKDGQSVPDRVVEMFGSRLGYKSVDEVLEAMRTKKHLAHQRGLEYARNAYKGQMQFQDGDIFKGVEEMYITSILQNGSVAKEFLGSSSSQDSTPYDTDVIVNKKISGSFSEVLSRSATASYGKFTFVLRDRGQFVQTATDTTEPIDPGKLELFHSGVVSEQHYGIRTGFPTTEIDFIVSKLDKDYSKSLFFEIVQNGYYIPVVDSTGKIMFTPDDYKTLRKFYAGLDRFDGDAFVYEQTDSDSRQFSDVEKAKSQLVESRDHVNETTKTIQDVVSEVLASEGIHLKDKIDTSIVGAELFDTGSTGRNTNLPDSFDFDLALKLDLGDEIKIGRIKDALRFKLNPKIDNSHGGTGVGTGDLFQLRFEGAQIGGASIDIDIAFVKKSELVVYGSHDAVKEKLDGVRERLGDEAADTIIANIVVAKEVLKKGGAYKKQEQGGMGGIGVENWILAHGGNFASAARAFWTAAHGGMGTLKSLDEFKKDYQIIDPGINVKFQAHDNFVQLLKETGYKNMLKTISEYFGWS
ncbi:MAG: hypothetical protein ACD_72C00245G0001, partial [uncultured bacterium]